MSDVLAKLKSDVGGWFMVPDWQKIEMKQMLDTAFTEGEAIGRAKWAAEIAERINKSDPPGKEISVSLAGEVINIDMHKWYAVIRADEAFICAVIQDTGGLWWSKDEAEFEGWLNGG